jgi:hypothetical protein
LNALLWIDWSCLVLAGTGETNGRASMSETGGRRTKNFTSNPHRSAAFTAKPWDLDSISAKRYIHLLLVFSLIVLAILLVQGRSVA